MKHPNNSDISSDEQVVSSQDTSFGDILNQFEHDHPGKARVGQALEGTVIAVNSESVFVDVGRKIEGIIPTQQLTDSSGKPSVKAGDKVLVSITGRNDEGYYELSTIRVERPKDWSGLEAAFAEHRIIGGVVTEVVKGGLRVDIGTPAFMPASRSGAKDAAEMEKLVGQEIRCRITKLEVANEDVVVDRRSVLEEEAKQSRETIFQGVQESMVLRGTVRSVMDFGAFVDLGGVDGLLHVTDISWSRIGKPSDVLKVGDSIEVKVLKVNRDTHKISLGMKQLQHDPWTVAAEKFKVGDRVHGTVSRLTDFGAFVTLQPGIDGLIHISEMSWSKKLRKPGDAVSVGDNVDVVVLGVNAAEHRISLGLKQTLGDPWEEAQQKFQVGSVVEGPVTSLANFGAFIDLGNGIEGMIHIGDITREKRLDHPREMLKTGQVVKASVLELDREKHRIRLGMKQLEPTSADEFISEHQPGETVTGRVVEVKQEKAKVELGEGVFATCRISVDISKESGAAAGSPKADLSSLTAMLNAKWKQGGASEEPGNKQAPAKAGQVRTFRIVSLDPSQKKIQLELM
jgi:small subunit ribosomal protein S1